MKRICFDRFIKKMPTILLIDCSLGMAERFSFTIKQGDNMATTMNIEKRSLIAKIIEALMTNVTTPTKLDTISVVSLLLLISTQIILYSNFSKRYSLRVKIQLRLYKILQRIPMISSSLFKNYQYLVICH